MPSALTVRTADRSDGPDADGEGANARVRGLDVRFASGVHAVRRVDLELGRGEILGLVGESGSGKTLLGLSLLGLAPPEADLTGEAWLGDTEMVAASAEQRRLARRERAGRRLSGPDDLAQPDDEGRPPGRRGGGLDRRRRASCSPRPGSPTPRAARSSTRTSSPAGCASGR